MLQSFLSDIKRHPLEQIACEISSCERIVTILILADQDCWIAWLSKRKGNQTSVAW